jgi:hypothetical protein
VVAPNNGRFSFGVGGYVKRLAQERNYHVPDGRVSIWRVSTSIVPKLQRRLVVSAYFTLDTVLPSTAHSPLHLLAFIALPPYSDRLLY